MNPRPSGSGVRRGGTPRIVFVDLTGKRTRAVRISAWALAATPVVLAAAVTGVFVGGPAIQAPQLPTAVSRLAPESVVVAAAPTSADAEPAAPAAVVGESAQVVSPTRAPAVRAAQDVAVAIPVAGPTAVIALVAVAPAPPASTSSASSPAPAPAGSPPATPVPGAGATHGRAASAPGATRRPATGP